jgi:putative Mn2+ efflux pump MntP
MDTLGLYGLIFGAAILIAVGLRFVVYSFLVNNSKWLPEKATKVANTTCVVAIAVALVLIAGNAVMSGHVNH